MKIPQPRFILSCLRPARRFAGALTLMAALPAAVQGQSATNIISGAIGVPGERDAYTFNVSTNSRFYFDALNNVGNLQWSLSGAQGSIVANRPFAGSDSQSIAYPLVLLPAGNYTLTIDSAGGTTNAYAFRWVNLVDAALLVPGSPVSGSLNPAVETDFYQFTANAGDRFFFDQITRVTLPNTYWRLFDPYGSEIFGQGFSDVGSVASPTTLLAAGTYTLLIEGYIGDSGSGTYSFNVSPQGNTPPVPFTGTPFIPGELVVSNFVAGATNFHLFILDQAAFVLFDTQTNSPGVNWTLEGPQGVVVNNRAFNNSDRVEGFPLLSLPAGSYQLRVRGSSSNPYRFRLIDLASATPFTPGIPVTGTLAPRNATVAYVFTNTPGARMFGDILGVTNLPNGHWRIFGPLGADFGSLNMSSDLGLLNFALAGRHYVVIEGYFAEGDSSGGFSFNLVPVADGSQALTLGNVVLGSVTTPGQRQNYSFTLPTAARLHFDSRTNNNGLRWSLDGPTGNFVNTRSFASSDGVNFGNPILNLPPGEYMLSVFGPGDNTGGFGFRLMDLAAAVTMTPGTPVNGTMSPASETDAYQFTLLAPGKFYFDFLNSGGMPNASQRLIDTHGNFFMNTSGNGDVGPFTLPAGTYTLLLEGYHSDPGNGTYGFNLLPVTDVTQPLVVGNVVSGNVTAPGQLQRHTFTLAAAARLHFDSRTINNGLRWSLDGPTGNFVSIRGFGNSDGPNWGSPLLFLPPGDYTLTVSGSGDNIGGYQFRLIDVATAAAMTPGTPVSGTLNPASETDAYQFALIAPGRFFYDPQTVTGLPNATVRLLDAFGNFFINANLSTDTGPFNLPAGSYTLLFEGYHSDPGNGSYTFNFTPVNDATQALTLGNVVPGSVAIPGQVQRYTFSLGAAARLHFDSRTNSGGLRWSLDGPTANFVSNRTFGSSDGPNFGSPVLYLPQGSYTLSVSGSGDIVGGYQFRLIDLSTAALLTPGTAVSDTLNPSSETDTYQFTLGTPGRFFYDPQTITGLPNATVRLVDAYGNFFINGNLATDAGPFNLPAGNYTLLLEGYHSESAASGNYTFNLGPVNDATQALTLGATVNGNINTPGQAQLYTFTLGAATRLYFDSLLNSGSIRWSLDGPTGNHVNNRAFTGSDGQNISNPLLPLPPGNYTLTVFGNSDSTGAFQFRLLDLAAATVLTPGTPVSVVNSPANQTTPYRFTAAAGDRFYFDYQSSASMPNAYWRLVDPYNNILFSQGLASDGGTNMLISAGTYTVLIEGYVGDLNLGSYAFNVRPEGNLPPVPFTGTPLILGNTNSGNLATASTNDAYTFTLGAPARLYFDALVNAGFTWTLRGPGGLWVNSRGFQSSEHVDIANPLLDLPAGAYQLAVSGAAGAYQFRLLDFASATAFTPGNVVSNSLAPARTTVFYRFTGTAGQRLYFDGRLSSGFTYAPYVRLYGPLGNIVMAQNVNDDRDVFTLNQSGTYTVTVEGRIYDNNASGNYAFNFQPVTDGTNALTIGATVIAAATTVGERQYYTFTLATPRQLYFDSLTNVDFYWRLDAPRGQVVNWRAFNASDGNDFANPLLDLPAASYVLTVAANNFAFAGDYRFRLLDFAAATPFTPGNVVSNSLTPTRLTEMYRFNGTAGQRLYYDGRPTTGFQYQPYVRIYSPLGNIVLTESVNADSTTFTLPQSGAYTLLVEGRVYDINASGNYSFNLQPVVDGTNALIIGATINNSATTVGQVQYYTFSLAGPRQLYFDSLTNVDFYWRLDAPWGQIVNWRALNASDGADFANPMLSLSAGDYTLAVAPNSFSFTGDCQFRLIDFATATPFTPGNVVSNSLVPTRSTVFYQFTGAAGQKFYFDGRTSSGFQYQPHVRIYAPLGNIILSLSVNSDQDTFTLTQDGTYLLTVEGRVYDNNASGTYAFNLVPVTYPTNLLSVGGITAGSLTTPGQRHYYNLSLPVATNLYFDSLTNGDFYWRLDASWGQVVDWRAFNSSDGPDLANPLLALSAGDYLMTVAYASFTSTGDYRFRLLNFSAATPFTPGNLVSNALAPANSTVLYQFNGAAGDRFYFDGRTTSGFTYQPYVRIYGPLGNIIQAQYINGDVDTFTLVQSGNYTLTVEGRVYDFNASGNYAFDLVPNPANPSVPLFQTNAAPDLIVSAVSVTPPGGVQSGESPTINWTVQNAGTVATAGSFTDRVTIRNTATGQIIANSTLLYNEAAGGNGPIAPGGTRSRQLVVALPDGTNSAGTLEVTVTTDTLNNILEQNSGGSAEANNSASVNITTTLSPYPDLRVHSVGAAPPTGWLPDSVVTVHWRLTNAGPRAAGGNWTDNVVIRNTNAAQVILNASTNYLQADAGNGPIAPGGFRDRALSFTVPNNANAYGVFEIVVTTDNASQVFEFIPGINAETNNSLAFLLISAPDLVIQNVSVLGDPSLQSGAAVTVQWSTENNGSVETGGGFYDRVRVRNLDTTEVLVDTPVFYNPGGAGNGPIPPGGARTRSYNFNLPNGPRGAGALEVTVTADTLNNLSEGNVAGNGEANNATTVSVGSALAPSPDLQVVSLSVQPASIASGTNLTILWAVTNSGLSRATASWYDRVLIVNTNLPVTLLDTIVFFDTGGPGPLTNGTARNRSFNFTLPNNVNGSGGLLISVTADRFDNVFEFNAGGTGESNNTTSLSINSSFSPLPDLAVHDIIAPASATAGQTISLIYSVTNRGTAPAVGSWFDTIFVSTDAAIGSDSSLLNPNVSATIPVGGSLTRTQQVTIPINGDAGTLRFVVQTDSGNSISELIENNNASLDAENFTVPLALQLSLSATEIGEDAVNPNVTATLTRNGSRAAPLVVNVMSTDTSEMVVPATVTIPANLASLTFQATAQLDGLYDGPQSVSIVASAAGFTTGSAGITVVDANIPRLTFSLSTSRIIEGGPGLTATVTREPVTASSLVVQLSSPAAAQLSFPATATILSSAASASFAVNAVDDLLIERTNTYTLNGAAAGFVSGAANIIVEDNDIPSVTISLATHTVSEGAGANATSGTATRSPVTPQAVVVELISGNAAAAQVPGSITIPPNQPGVSFSVAAINNSIVDGDKNAAIGGFVLDSTTSQRLREAAPDALTVTDDDGPTLTLAIATDVVGEGLNPATTATVTRNTDTSGALLVNLASSDVTEATAPPGVNIPAGSLSASFNIASIADGVTDGNQTVTFSASAGGFTSGTDTLVVSDADRPDLVVTEITFATTNGITDQNVAATFRIENRGLTPVTNAFSQRVYLSTDPFVGGDVLAAQIEFTGGLGVGAFFSQTVALRMPAAPGQRWVVVETDVNNAVTELLENNNTRVSTNRIFIEPAYTALAQTDAGVLVANTPVLIYGQATLAGGGIAANVPLTIHIEVRGVRRTFDIFSGPDGRFTNVFHPLPNEGGVYHIAAAYPGVVNPPSQDSFTLLGMSIAPVGLVNVIEGGSVTGTTRIDNLSDVPLNGLTAQVITNQPNLTVNVSVNTNVLGGLASATLDYSIAASDAFIFQSPVIIQVASAEGVVARVTLTVRVEALRARLVATPASLLATMLRGGQASVPFTLANQGGLTTGPLEVLLPNEPWLALASSANLPPLPPGSNTTITLLLTPAADLPLGDYNGNLVVRSTNSALSVPFSFRAVSDAKGSLLVTAEDEYTYFAAGSPRVTNAAVILSDALSGRPVLTNYTGADGMILITNVTEAYYVVDVRADGHSSFRETALVQGGQTTNVVAFLTRQTVHYSFTVVPTTVEDRYVFQVDSTFETQVPLPVCTISPASLDLSAYPGDEFQVQFTVANHGLIAAEHVALNIPNTDRLEFTPLITDIGRLAANSSLTIPVLVKRLPPPPAPSGGFTLADYLTGQCSVNASMLWDYLCGPNVVDKSTAFYVFDSTGCNIVDLYRQVYDLVPDGGGTGTGPVLTSDEFFDFLESLNPVTDFEAPPGYHFECRPTPPSPSPLPGQFQVASAAGTNPPNNEVCARVQIRLDQKAVLARDAFKATLELDNETPTALENILVNLEIKDAFGNVANSVFGIRPPEFVGMNAVDGTGLVAGQTEGRASWILIPTLDAAPTNGISLYLVGGTLSYVQDGTAVTIPLAPAPIQVFPQPELLVRYFHERDVFADDPFTTEVEPSIPYSLAVQIANVGYGAARSLKLTSGQPQIVDNQKGLLIDFRIIGTQLENQSLTPSLEADFGRIEPKSNKVARWLFTSTLQGNFTNFNASFQHVDALGNPRLSLVRSVEIHELNHIVLADRTFQDGRPDFLVNGAPDPDRLPDTLYLSDGSNAPVSAVTTASFVGTLSPGNLQVTLNATVPPGWIYLVVPNPAGTNDFRLTGVRRADSSVIALGTNAWTTGRVFPGGATRPIRTNLLHLIDFNSTGSYTLLYESSTPQADSAAPSSAVATLPPSSPAQFAVNWSGVDAPGGTGIAFFDIFVSVNGGPATNWLPRTTLNGAIFNGVQGSSYAFFSVATDSAGNVESAPSTPDTQTAASVVNTPPTLSLGGTRTIDEGAVLNITPTAGDTDTPTQTLTFALLPGAPGGILFNAANGAMTWPTGEGNGPTTNQIRVRVSDNGQPSLSATASVFVIVREVNTAPVLAVVTNSTINELFRLTFFATASDPDAPQNTLSFSLGGSVPAGATIDPVTGQFSWRPSGTQGPSTNHLRIVVTDNGSPALTAVRDFTVFVRDSQADYFVAVGSTNVFAGATGSVSVTLNAALSLSELQFNLDASSDRLLGLAMGSLSAEVIAVTLQPAGVDRSQVRFNLSGSGPLASTRVLGLLSFIAQTNRPSAIVPLQLSGLSAKTIGGQSINFGQAADGRIIIVSQQPVLTLGNAGINPRLTLYGKPGSAYVIETRTNLNSGTPWTPLLTTSLDLDTVLREFLLTADKPQAFYRAYELDGTARLEAMPNGSAILLLIRGPVGALYGVQSTTNLAGGTWQSVTSLDTTNAVHVLSLPNDGSPARFYRLVAP